MIRNALRRFAKHLLLQSRLTSRILRGHEASVIRRWRRAGRTAPPPHAVKRALVKRLLKSQPNQFLVETGTFQGDMIEAARGLARRIVTIELDTELFMAAKTRFRHDTHVTVLHGDSAALLGRLSSEIEGEGIYWLDAHYSGPGTSKALLNTPVIAELAAIMPVCTSKHTILIDDARHFNGHEDYPSVEEVRQFVAKTLPTHTFTVKQDVIQIRPLAVSGAQTDLRRITRL